ncbi:MAG: FIST N-terminal domain-containing protein, partial [Bacteroidota bacterium]
MHIQFGPDGTTEEFGRLAQSIAQRPEVEGLLIMACDGNALQADEVDPILHQASVPVIGGVFPELIYNGQKYQKGTIVAGLSAMGEILVVPKLDKPETDFSDLIETHFPEVEEGHTMLVFVDGLSSQIGSFINSLFFVLGLEVNYLGGGAGSLDFEKRDPCLFSNQGMLSNHALLSLLPIQSGVGVKHGYKSISGPYQVTESEGNVIKTLDWEPAFEVYKRVIEHTSGLRFGADNFFDIAKGFPFGIKKMGEEVVVRDPIVAQEDGSLVCVGWVPDDAFVDILEGKVASLVQAAQQAMLDGIEALDNEEGPRTHIFIDCISRVLFMEEEFRTRCPLGVVIYICASCALQLSQGSYWSNAEKLVKSSS